ncbi:hypothetical protein Leryth_018147 [Lithospermum erythrorhizon]|nr:hypothetical protein Leryth_018147 [Lithospermum erythrorhizon]
MSIAPTGPPTPSTSHWNSVVFALVGSICIIILLCSFFKILQHYCSIFCARAFYGGNRGPRELLNDQTDNSVVLSRQSLGLDSYIMHSLPITQFKGNAKDDLPSNIECAVCLGEFEEGEWLKSLPNCSHVFHVACIDTWFQAHSSCPLCRTHVYNSSMQQDRSLSIEALIETLRRGGIHQELSEQQRQQSLSSQLSQSSPIHSNNPVNNLD